MNAILIGSLAVEPFNQQTRWYGPAFACSLCGEGRKTEPHVRRYRFRTSEDEGAQKFPLCDYCLGRLRATGDFLGFLRMVRDGHWRADNEEEQKGAWEEAVRLRERMFWARLGGGVVPAMQMLRRAHTNDKDATLSPESVRAIKSARPSLDSIPEGRRGTQTSMAGGAEEDDAEVDDAPEAEGVEAPLPVSEAERSLPVMQPPQQRKERAMSGIGAAIVGASSGVLSTARPDVSPQASAAAVPQVGDATAVLRPIESEAEDEEATTPFEDAQTDSQVEQEASAAQLQAEADAAAMPPPALPIFTEPDSPPAVEGLGAEVPQLPELEERKSRELTTPPNLHERRASAVLARVRAMEAKAQGSPPKEKKFPGAFD